MNYIHVTIGMNDGSNIRLSLSGYSLTIKNQEETFNLKNQSDCIRLMRLREDIKTRASTIDSYPSGVILRLRQYSGDDVELFFQDLWFAVYYNRLTRLGHEVSWSKATAPNVLLERLASAYAKLKNMK